MNSNLVLTIPNMEYLAHIYHDLFKKLGCPFIPPPPLSRRTSELGKKYGRESYCMPLNNNIGDVILAIKNGATAVVMPTETDSCRYPLYWVSIKMAVDRYFEKDIPFFLINHDSPGDARKSVFGIVQKIHKSMSYQKFLKEWKHSMYKVHFLSRLNDIANAHKYREKSAGSVSGVMKQTAHAIIASSNFFTSLVLFYAFRMRIPFYVKKQRARPVKILLVGEIYEVIEPKANYAIEDYLCSLGCIVKRSLNQNDLVPVLSPSGCAAFLRAEDRLYRAAKKVALVERPLDDYGGFGMMTIGHAAQAKARGFDGIVHLYSFSCMPEIIAKPFLKKISDRDNIPVISVVVEELTSRDVFTNRLEAFVDMVRERQCS